MTPADPQERCYLVRQEWYRILTEKKDSPALTVMQRSNKRWLLFKGLCCTWRLRDDGQLQASENKSETVPLSI